MRTKTIKLYQFNELSPEAKEKAIENYRDKGFEYSWARDNENTLKVFTEIFPVKVTEWEYGYRNYINFEMTCDQEIADFTGIRLLKYIYNNYYHHIFKPKYLGHIAKKKTFTQVYSRCQKENSCVLTGYCIDDDILEPMYKFLKKPNEISFSSLIEFCLNAWIKACNNDYQYQLSDEAISEHLEINEYEFLENGEIQ